MKIVCGYCGNEFYREDGRKGKTPKYCSKSCKYEAEKLHKRIRWAATSPFKKSHCDMCGKELLKGRSRFCSTECKARYNHLKQGRISHNEILTKTCVICGKTFETWKTRKSTCSEDCKKELRRIHHEKRYKGITIDKDITLAKVAERDGNICQICGLFVDWDDRENIENTIICGGMYPSIDHIVPISCGGLHSWENVRLAHRVCNSRKSNKVG